MSRAPAKEEGGGAMVSGIILAGGAARGMRMRNMVLLPYEGEALLDRQIRLMDDLCQEIILVTGSPKSYLPLVPSSVRIVSDYMPGRGALGGLAAGLSLSQQRYAWVVGCDMPKLSPAAARLLLKRLIGNYEAVWPSDKDGPHPLHGVYDCECAGRIAKLVEEGGATLADLPGYLAWGEVAEGEFAQQGIAFDFLETIRGTGFHARPAIEESRFRAGI
ncbi:molybdenum cofactor guanylyltransferase [Cohnella thailandensis]|uniref:NTP transferase domain-containing protein n=1 Tax=Cohnella thailandensis TaxID=557557 RepID=A0A841T550_9BACL|nr:NTP transferase domain-containing protein [Cohnella thailandensis]MBB6637976.1 NTP transferase domain-containing protein [Cohnella thailandensis]MBP1976885.1 molybdopterin-guanine dinucleotide biosynthesis protein A [Cohnella thailandensis]